jgi:hypothetical protein
MTKRIGRLATLCMGLSGLVGVAWSQALAPVIFNYTLTSKPGDIVSLQGARFGSSPSVWLHSASSEAIAQLPIVSQPSADTLTVQLPAAIAGPQGGGIRVAVHSGSAVSNVVGLNAARAYALDGLEIVPGAHFRIVGRNLRMPGFVPHVRVGGIDATVDLNASDENLLSVTAPLGLQATSNVEIMVDNGNGTGPSTLDKPIAVNAIPAADPFQTGLGWTSVFGPLVSRVLDPTSDARLGGNLVKCDGSDDRTALQNAIYYVYSSLHGGVVQLPKGVCHIHSSLQLLNNVILQGALDEQGRLATTLTFDGDGGMYATNPGDHNLAVRNLSVLPTDPLGASVAAITFGNVNHVLIQNVQIPVEPKWFSVYMSGVDNAALLNSSLSGLVYAPSMRGFALSGNAVRFGRSDGSTPQPADSGAVSLDVVSQGVVLNNHFTRQYKRVRRYPGDVLHIATVNFASRLLIQGNTFDVNGDPIEPYWNDGETILNEGGGPCQTSNPGIVDSATATTLTDPVKLIDFNSCHLQPSDFAPLYRGQVVQIVSGTGMGQTRYITGYDTNTRTLTVDQPWDVLPDSSSRYVASVMGMEKTIIKGNAAYNNPRGINLVSGSMREIDIVDNHLANNEGIVIESPANLSDPGKPLFYLSTSINISRNVVDTPRDPFPATIRVRQVQWDEPYAFGTGIMDVVVRDNQITAHTPNLLGANIPEGYVSDVLASQGVVDNGIPQMLGVVFQRNTCLHCDPAYRLSTGNNGTVIDSPNDVDGGQFIQHISIQTDASHTPHADVGTVYGAVPSSVALSVSNAAVDQGQALGLVAQVSGVNPGGAVQFMDGGSVLGTVVLDASGMARLDTASLVGAGLHQLSAAYAGDAANLPGTSASSMVTVSNLTVVQDANAPVVLNHTLTVHPGDVLALQGMRFGSQPQVWLSAAGNQPDRTIQIVNIKEALRGALSVRLPADAAYPIILRVYNGSGWSAPVVLGQARPYNLDALEIVPGGRFRVLGRNLMTPGFTPRVWVGGVEAALDLAHSDENLLVVNAPAELGGSLSTQVSVDNGNGSGAAVLDRVIAVNHIPAADPFGLGVGWTAIFAPMMQQVLDPTADANDFRMLVDARLNTRFVHCQGDSGYDDLPAIQFGLIYLSGTGGGVLQLPPGICHISGAIQLLGNTILQGSADPTNPTIIQYDSNAAYASANNIAVRNISFQPGPNATWPFYITGYKRIVIQNVKVLAQRTAGYQNIYNNTNVVISGSSFAGPATLANAGFVIENNTLNYQADAGLNLGQARDGLVTGNTITRTVTDNLATAQARALNMPWTSRVQLINNQIRATGSPLTAGQAALYVVDGKGLNTGTVQSATPLSLTDASNIFTTTPFGNNPNADGQVGLPDNDTVAIVSGTGAGQVRHIRGIDASGHTLYLDQGWDVLPDTSSHYTVLIMGMERSLIKGNVIANFPGSIALQDSGLNEVDLVGNFFSDTGGLSISSRDDTTSQYFAPVYNLTLDGNQFSSPIRSWRQTVNISHTQIGSGTQAFGAALLDTVVRNNQILGTANDVSLGKPGGYTMLGYLVSNQSGPVNVLGPVFQNNVCRACPAAYSLSAPVRGATIDSPVSDVVPLSSAQLISHVVNNAAPSNARTDLNTVLSHLPVALSLSAPSGAPALGQTSTFTLTVSATGAVTGLVQFKDGGQNLGSPVTLSYGTAQLSVSNLPAGNHTVSASYLGDTGNAATGSTAQIFSVAQAEASVTLMAAPLSLSDGQPLTVDVSVQGYLPAGAVQLFIDGQPWGAALALSNGAAQLLGGNLQALAAGNHVLTASYAGDVNNTSASTAVPVLFVINSSSNNGGGSDGTAGADGDVPIAPIWLVLLAGGLLQAGRRYAHRD